MSAEEKEIINYLNGNLGYHFGVAILSKHTKNKHIIRMLSVRQNPDKLKYELNKILDTYEKEKKHTEGSSQAPSSKQKSTGGSIEQNLSQLPEKGRRKNDDHRSITNSYAYRTGDPAHCDVRHQIEQDRKKKYRLRGHLHGQLHNASSVEERFKLCRKIILLQKEIDRINIDYRRVLSGEIPSNYLKQTRSAEEYVRIKNVKLYISRYEKKLSAAANLDEKKRIEQKLEQYRTELSSLL